MIGNFPINDDWVFVRQIEAFSKGIFTLNAELDPSFIAQGFLGLMWGKVFGISFQSLHLLTILITLLGVWGFIKILKLFKLRKHLIIFSAILYFFNPLQFINAFTFMTESYFQTFFVWALYFLLNYFQTQKLKYVLMGNSLAILASLTRHTGIIILVSLELTLILIYLKNRSRNKLLLPPILAILATAIIIVGWPRYGVNRSFIFFDEIGVRLRYMLLSLHYFPLFIFPMLLGLQLKLKRQIWVVAIVLTALFAILLFNYDIFPVGNTFYIENIYVKSYYSGTLSLFNNVFFKLVFCVLVGFAVTKLILSLRTITQKSYFILFVGLTGILLFVTLLFSSDFYDRYLLPSFLCFFIIVVVSLNEYIKITKLAVGALLLLAVVVSSLQWEFYVATNLKWQQVRKLQAATGPVTQIELNDTYINYETTWRADDFTGLISRRASFEPKCFVQAYTRDSDSWWGETFQTLHEKVEQKFLANPRPLDVKKRASARAAYNLDKLIYNDEYFSIIYNLVGKRAYVGSWCVEDL